MKKSGIALLFLIIGIVTRADFRMDLSQLRPSAGCCRRPLVSNGGADRAPAFEQTD